MECSTHAVCSLFIYYSRCSMRMYFGELLFSSEPAHLSEACRIASSGSIISIPCFDRSIGLFSGGHVFVVFVVKMCFCPIGKYAPFRRG